MSYGQEGEAYAVAPGEVWHCAGATFRCGDVRDYTPPAHDLLYCDPPWNNAMIKQFAAKAGVEVPNYGFLALYMMVIEKAGLGVPVWVEAGNHEAPQVYDLLPGPLRAVIPITYYRQKPGALLYSGPGEPPGHLLTMLRDMDDAHTPAAVMAAYGAESASKPLLVVDPCAGRGLTARAAYGVGWESDNNELHPRRVSAALARMVKLTGQEAVRIG